MRKILVALAGFAVLGIAFLLANYMKGAKRAPRAKPASNEQTVFVKKVSNVPVSIYINANGNLIAKHRVALYAEVQGALKFTGKDFRAGVAYRKGEPLLAIDSDEHYATLQAQKSSLQNLIASMLPDLRLDYPQSFKRWESYLRRFDVGGATPPLPKPSSDREKYFIVGKNIYTHYYNIKNLEARQAKYTVRAPFDGVLTEALVTTGTLVRIGQQVGEFIDPSVFELPLAVKAEMADILQVGKTVELHNLDKTATWTGRVARVNSRIDQTSQTVRVFIAVSGAGLLEGMYLEARVEARRVPAAVEIDRKLLVNNKAVFVAVDNTLRLRDIDLVHVGDDTVVIRGLRDGELLVVQPAPGAYDGMPVKAVPSEEDEKLS